MYNRFLESLCTTDTDNSLMTSGGEAVEDGKGVKYVVMEGELTGW